MTQPRNRILLSALFNQPSGIDDLFTSKYYGEHGIDSIEEKGDRVLIIWGGEDISPMIYKQKPNRQNRGSTTPSVRDQAEMKLAEWAVRNNVPIIGICRGAQLMCALSGGKLIQHVTGHYGDHNIHCPEIAPGLGDIELTTSSIHHQMMLLTDVEHVLLGFTHPAKSDTYLGENNEEISECFSKDWCEPEIVWIPKTKSLCIQGHPEYMKKDAPFVKYVQALIDYFIFQKHYGNHNA